MASEVIAATTTPITNTGTTHFGAAGLVHTSRILNAVITGTLDGQKFSNHTYSDSTTVQYSVDGGSSWSTWFSFSAGLGLEDLNDSLEPVSVSVAVPITQILVSVVTSQIWPATSISLHDISLTGDDTGIAAGTYYAEAQFI